VLEESTKTPSGAVFIADDISQRSKQITGSVTGRAGSTASRYLLAGARSVITNLIRNGRCSTGAPGTAGALGSEVVLRWRENVAAGRLGPDFRIAALTAVFVIVRQRHFG